VAPLFSDHLLDLCTVKRGKGGFVTATGKYKGGSSRPQLYAKKLVGRNQEMEEEEERIKQIEAQLICNVKITQNDCKINLDPLYMVFLRY